MNRRIFARNAGLLTLGAATLPLIACKNKEGNSFEAESPAMPQPVFPFELAPLSFAYNALVPIIDEQTMMIHHDKHHAGYVTKLNAALENSEMKSLPLLEILQKVSDSEADTAIRNNAGGHFNHQLFWEVLTPGGKSMPEGKLAEAITSDLTGFDAFKTSFADAASKVFGSGWAWLIVNADKKLEVVASPNQDNPLMSGVVEKTGIPILGIDVWEHAYYLNYQNKRKDYIDGFMGLINWDMVAARYTAAMG